MRWGRILRLLGRLAFVVVVAVADDVVAFVQHLQELGEQYWLLVEEADSFVQVHSQLAQSFCRPCLVFVHRLRPCPSLHPWIYSRRRHTFR